MSSSSSLIITHVHALGRAVTGAGIITHVHALGRAVTGAGAGITHVHALGRAVTGAGAGAGTLLRPSRPLLRIKLMPGTARGHRPTGLQ